MNNRKRAIAAAVATCATALIMSGFTARVNSAPVRQGGEIRQPEGAEVYEALLRRAADPSVDTTTLRRMFAAVTAEYLEEPDRLKVARLATAFSEGRIEMPAFIESLNAVLNAAGRSALIELQRAAHGNDVWAQYFLASAHLSATPNAGAPAPFEAWALSAERRRLWGARNQVVLMPEFVRDHAAALDLLKRAAGARHPAALGLLAGMHRDGKAGLKASAEEALRLYRDAADLGDPASMQHLGHMHLDGNGVAADDGEAVRWFRRATDRGGTWGIASLGWCHEMGRGVPVDPSTAVAWYSKGAALRDMFSTNRLGSMYSAGSGVTQDHARSSQFYRQAALLGEPAAMRSLAWAYHEGRGVERSDTTAFQWQYLAARLDDTSAMAGLGWFYERGIGIEKNDKESAAWYLKAADRGVADAMNSLALMYADGRGVEKNEAEAARWLRRGADAGHPWAMANLAYRYAKGTPPLGKDAGQAFRWYRRAAELGNVAAMERVAWSYFAGLGTERDDAAALRWYRRAADLGDLNAQYRLGVMYGMGLGVAKDLSEARRWYSRVAERDRDMVSDELQQLEEAAARGAREDGVIVSRARRDSAGPASARDTAGPPSVGSRAAALARRPELVVHTPPLILVDAVAISDDGRWFVATSFGSMTIHDTASGRPLRSIELGGSMAEGAAAIGPGGMWIVIGADENKTISRWNARSGRAGAPFERHARGDITDLVFSPDGRFLAGAGTAHAIYVWEFATGKLVRTIQLPEVQRRNGEEPGDGLLAYSPDGRTLIVGHPNGHVYTVEMLTGQPRVLYSHNRAVRRVLVSPDGRTIVSTDFGGDVFVWNHSEPERAHAIEASEDTDRTAIGFAWAGAAFIVTSTDAFIFWDTVTLRPVARVEMEPTIAPTIAVNRTGRFVVAVHSTARDMGLVTELGKFTFSLSVWDLADGREVSALRTDSHIAAPPLLTADRGSLVTTAAFGGLNVWDVPSGRVVRHLEVWGVTGAALTPDGRTLVTLSKDGYAQTWNTETWAATAPVDLKHPNLLGVMMDVSPDGTFVAVPVGEMVKVWNVRTGARVNELRTAAGRAIFVGTGGRLATIGQDKTVRFWSVQNGSESSAIRFEASSSFTAAAARTSSGDAVFVSDSNGVVSEVHAETGVVSQVIDTKRAVSALATSPDGRLLVTALQAGGIHVWDLQSRAAIATFESDTLMHGVLWASNRTIVASSPGGSLAIFNIDDPSARTIARANADGSKWVVVHNAGFFDGTPGGWDDLLWRFSEDTFDVAPVEAFFNEFYRPGLMSLAISGRVPKPPATIALKDRRSPSLTIETVASGDTRTPGAVVSSRTVSLRITAAEAGHQEKGANGGGVRDLRLFRNGSLVKVWRGDVVPAGRGRTVLEATVPIVAGENRFTAYAFNRDNVKSTDAGLTLTGDESLRRKGTLYVIAVGINEYANRDFNLRYAVADAGVAADEIARQQQRLQQYARIEVVRLFDRDATKSNIVAALRALAGATPPGAPEALKPLKRAEPEDAVIIYYAGHGTAVQSRFYFIPHDVSYSGAFPAVSASEIKSLLRNSLSDAEVETAVEGIDAGHLVLVVDACNSGQALEPEDRLGPMNSKGLAQLAYEKGMYVLAAAQSTQAAQEVVALGHGLLSFTLVIEGMQSGNAAREGLVDTASWFDYAVRRVPELQRHELDKARQKGRQITFVEGQRSRGVGEEALQRPRAYYRDRRGDDPLVLARKQK